MDPRGPANPREREANRDAPECLLATLPSETDAGDRRSSAPPRLQGDRVRKELVMSRLFKGRVETPTIGRFEIVRPIGAGAMGVVYEARDPKLGRRVALKVLQSTETERSPRARARMLREAQAMAHVAHPNIVTVHDAGEVEGQVFLAMELVRGITLEHWMEAPDQRARPWREVVRVFVDAGRGLAAAHAAGIVHRDFKPGNVMVGEHGLVKVLDFGLARAPSAVATDELAATHDDDRPSLWSSTVALTRTGAILGTPAYMSPEQHRGELASASSDQFSF